jgi:hypothetical protein
MKQDIKNSNQYQNIFQTKSMRDFRLSCDQILEIPNESVLLRLTATREAGALSGELWHGRQLAYFNTMG